MLHTRPLSPIPCLHQASLRPRSTSPKLPSTADSNAPQCHGPGLAAAACRCDPSHATALRPCPPSPPSIAETGSQETCCKESLTRAPSKVDENSENFEWLETLRGKLLGEGWVSQAFAKWILGETAGEYVFIVPLHKLHFDGPWAGVQRPDVGFLASQYHDLRGRVRCQPWCATTVEAFAKLAFDDRLAVVADALECLSPRGRSACTYACLGEAVAILLEAPDRHQLLTTVKSLQRRSDSTSTCMGVLRASSRLVRTHDSASRVKAVQLLLRASSCLLVSEVVSWVVHETWESAERCLKIAEAASQIISRQMHTEYARRILGSMAALPVAACDEFVAATIGLLGGWPIMIHSVGVDAGHSVAVAVEVAVRHWLSGRKAFIDLCKDVAQYLQRINTWPASVCPGDFISGTVQTCQDVAAIASLREPDFRPPVNSPPSFSRQGRRPSLFAVQHRRPSLPGTQWGLGAF